MVNAVFKELPGYCPGGALLTFTISAPPRQQGGVSDNVKVTLTKVENIVQLFLQHFFLLVDLTRVYTLL